MTPLPTKQGGSVWQGGAFLLPGNEDMDALLGWYRWGKQDYLFHTWADFTFSVTHGCLSTVHICLYMHSDKTRVIVVKALCNLLYHRLSSCRSVQERTCCTAPHDPPVMLGIKQQDVCHGLWDVWHSPGNSVKWSPFPVRLSEVKCPGNLSGDKTEKQTLGF